MKKLFQALTFVARHYYKSRRVIPNFPGRVDHNLQVVDMLITHNECGMDEERLLVAAALHDIFENIPLDKTKVSELFGAQVVELVGECTISTWITPSMKKHKILDALSTKSGMAKCILLADVCAELFEELYVTPTEGRTLNRSTHELSEYLAQVESLIGALYGRETYLDDYAQTLLAYAKRAYIGNAPSNSDLLNCTNLTNAWYKDTTAQMNASKISQMNFWDIERELKDKQGENA